MWQKRLVAFLSVFVCITPGIINALDCGGSFTKMSGDFHSPLQMVGENKCSWIIKLPNEYRIKLIFNSFLMVNDKTDLETEKKNFVNCILIWPVDT